MSESIQTADQCEARRGGLLIVVDHEHKILLALGNLTAMKPIVRLETKDPRMSQVVIRDGIVYMSGQVDEEHNNVEDQTKAILAKIDERLKAAGTDKSKLLTAQIWLKDINKDFKTMNKVWSAWVDPGEQLELLIPVSARTSLRPAAHERYQDFLLHEMSNRVTSL